MRNKVCSKCNLAKPITEFSKRGKSGRQPWCNSCKRQYNQQYYNTQSESISKSRKQRRAELRLKLRQYKADKCCAECGEDHPSCLEFHHRDPANKDICIGVAVSRLWSWKRIKSEIDKCDMLCSNCHRKLHWEEEHDE